MTVSCPDCRSVFRVDPAKVPANGVRARCSVCGGIIVVSGGTGSLRTPARTPVSAMATAVVGASGPGPMVSPVLTPVRPVRATPGAVPGAISPRNATPSATPGFVPRPSPRITPRLTPATAPATMPVPTPVSAASQSGTAESVAATPRRTINPFLNADPSQRAKRLARALVSDLVAYHPKKRDEGLAQGTLRQLFREEIKKSYEEYVDQVGKDLAESTPHFQEALNDILSGGQRIF